MSTKVLETAGGRNSGAPAASRAEKKEGAVQKEMGSPNYFKFTREFKSAKI